MGVSIGWAAFSHPAATTCWMANPAACATGVVDSAPRVTVHDWEPPVPPGATVTSISSDGSAGSATWNFVAFTAATGNAVVTLTVHDSLVPEPGAVVPPLLTVPAASLVNW